MIDGRLPWFQCFPSKWLGALAAMRPDEGYIYVIICFRIYEIGRPCPDTLEALAKRTGLNRRRVSDALDRLFKAGKLVRQADGIMNPFAAQILADAIAFREGRSRAGEKGATRRWGKNSIESKDDAWQSHSGAMCLPLANDGHLHLQEQKQKKDKKEREPRSRATQITPDWKADSEAVAYAVKNGFKAPEIELMAEAFRDHHRARGNVMIDWSAAWRTWVRNEVKFSAGRNGSRSTSSERPGGIFRLVQKFQEQERAENGEQSDARETEDPGGFISGHH